MAKTLFIMVFITILVLPLSSGANIEKEKEIIKQVALDYIEGFYEGSAERMERALHPEFHKKGLNLLKKTGKNMLSGAGYSKMVELTRLGLGKKTPKDKRNIKVIILDVFKNTASVKTISVDYMDYLHMVKFNGQWKILNVLWEANK
jgi:hypothetical protein